MKSHQRILLLTAWAGLFFSGMAACIYGLVWIRYLASALGTSASTLSLGLSMLLGGAAVGHYVMSRFVHRILRPMASFAWIEVSLGLYALLFPFFFHGCSSVYLKLVRSAHSALALNLSGSLLALATLLIPSMLLGGIMPVLMRLSPNSLDTLHSRSGILYGVHGLGGCLGGWLGFFWLIPGFGLASTTMAGASLNLIAGALAFLVSARWENVIQVANPALPTQDPSMPPSHMAFRPEQIMALTTAGITSLAGALCGVVWIRLLALALGPTAQVAIVVLFLTLGGLTLGSVIISRWPISSQLTLTLARILLCASLFIVLSMLGYDQLPYGFIQWSRLIIQPSGLWLMELGQWILAAGVVLLPSTAWGMVFPIITRLAAPSAQQAGPSTGLILATSLMGTLTGFLLGIWVLLPHLGLALSLCLALCLFLALSVALLGWTLPKEPFNRLAFGFLVLMIGLVLLSSRLTSLWQRSFSLGLWQKNHVPASYSDYRALIQAHQLVYYRDGAEASISLQQMNESNLPRRYWRVNGQLESAADAESVHSILSSHLPLLLHPKPENVLFIEADASACRRILKHETLRQLDLIESTPEVGRDIKKQVNAPQVRFVASHARRYLTHSQATYDVIINRQARPWRSGEADCLSREFYETCRRQLRPGGIIAQRLTTADTDDQVLDIIITTFTSVFPWTTLWQSGADQWMLVGSVHPSTVDLQDLEKRFEQPAIKADFERINVLRLPVLLAHEMIGQQNTMFAPDTGTPLQSDFYPVLQGPAQKAFLTRQGHPRYRQLDERFRTRPTTWWSHYLAKKTLQESDYEALALGFRYPETELLAQSILEGWQRQFPETLLPLELYEPFLDHHAPGLLVASRLGPSLHLGNPTIDQRPELLGLYARALLQNYRYQRSMFHRPPSTELTAILERLVRLDPYHQRTYKLHLAELAWDEQQDELCLRWGQNALHPDTAIFGPIQFALDPSAPGRVLSSMIESFWRSGQLAQAANLAEQAQNQGYASPHFKPRDPVLEMVCRKIQTFHSQAASQLPSPGTNAVTTKGEDHETAAHK